MNELTTSWHAYPSIHAFGSAAISDLLLEVHRSEWKMGNPGSADIIQMMIAKYQAPARWLKCVQHLRDSGKLLLDPKDIGNLLNEFKADLSKECEEEIKQELFNWAIGKISRGATHGLPEWYKEYLMTAQFENTGSSSNSRTLDFESRNGDSIPSEPK